MNDEQLWRQRYLIFSLVRIGGLLLFLLGLVISATDLVRPGGWPVAGFLISVVGIVDAVVGPILLKRRWHRQ
jgi:hypothetical protein